MGNEKLRVIFLSDEAHRGSGVSSTPEMERSQAGKGPQPAGATFHLIRRSRYFKAEKYQRFFVREYFNSLLGQKTGRVDLIFTPFESRFAAWNKSGPNSLTALFLFRYDALSMRVRTLPPLDLPIAPFCRGMFAPKRRLRKKKKKWKQSRAFFGCSDIVPGTSQGN